MERFRIAPLEFACDIYKKEEGVYCLMVDDIGCFEDKEEKYKLSEYYNEEDGGTIGFEILLSYNNIVDIRNAYNDYISPNKSFENMIIESDNGYIELINQYGGLFIEVGKTDSNGITIATVVEVDSPIGDNTIKYIKKIVIRLDELINSAQKQN